jgi:hypothetical protein
MYREVPMVEVKEVLRLWRAGLPRGDEWDDRARLADAVGLRPSDRRS